MPISCVSVLFIFLHANINFIVVIKSYFRFTFFMSFFFVFIKYDIATLHFVEFQYSFFFIQFICCRWILFIFNFLIPIRHRDRQCLINFNAISLLIIVWALLPKSKFYWIFSGLLLSLNLLYPFIFLFF